MRGRGGTFENPVIAEIAEKYQKTPAQVMLRWHIQRGVVVIPKSTHIERMEENFNVFDFTLSDEDMKTIAELDKKTSSFFSHQDPNMVEWFVKMVEERKKNNDSSKEKRLVSIRGKINESITCQWQSTQKMAVLIQLFVKYPVH